MRQIIASVLFCFMLPTNTWALELKKLKQPVVDDVGILRPLTLHSLNTKLRQLNDAGVAQIQVYITPTLDGLTIEEAAIQWANFLKLGDAKKDNGVLFLIAPNQRRMRIEVGQGLEGDITDVQAKRIIEDRVAPYFRRSQYDDGVISGVETIIGLLNRDPNALPMRKGLKNSNAGIFVIFIVFIAMIVLLQSLPRSRRRQVDYWSSSTGAWGSGNGSWGGGRSGGGWGGSGGGSWGGGGGGFSGGGASGGW